jgi:succinoglycan biosynthesis transport protein ExoP
VDEEFELEGARSFREYVAIAKRRWRVAALSFAVVFLVGAAVALLIPPVYRSSATILIEQQEIPQDLVRSTISSFADQRIQLIKQRVMTTSNLLNIIREHGLYADEIERKPREAIIERMRDDIRMNVISADVVDPRSGRPVQATIAFTVSYDNRSAERAVRVANELTSLYLQDNSQSRRQQAAEASSFLADEAKRLSEEITQLEARLADFKQANVDRLPELAQLNLSLVSRAEQELDDVQRDKATAEQRRLYLDAQLAQLSPNRDAVSSDGSAVLGPADRLRVLEANLAAMRGIYKPDHPDVVRTEKSIAALRAELGITADEREDLENELAALRAQRAALLDRYSEEHPDVVRLDRRIAAATERLSSAPQQSGGSNTPSQRADNPVYVQFAAQRAGAELDLQSLTQKEVALRKKLADLENRLLQTPSVERDYHALARDLDNARLKYQEVSAKQMEAVVAQNLENDSKAEHFTLIEPPLLPQRPIAPNRWLILALGVVLALGTGFGAVALREALDGSVHGPRELERLTRMLPLGVIPAILTPDEGRAKSRQRRRYAVATVSTLVALVVFAHFFVAPLDVLWFAALRRFGV